MMQRILICMAAMVLGTVVSPVLAQENDPERDILVTFDNRGARAIGTGTSAPYRNRKRYAIAADARRHADAIQREYSLIEVDHWPISSLSVYCFVYRVPDDVDRQQILAALNADERIESAQLLQEFETGTDPLAIYDDTYANLQHGLNVLGIAAAHKMSRGQGVRIAVIDTQADEKHEDLQGRLRKVEAFSGKHDKIDAEHGTAIVSIIGARANNARGIVGVAPQAELDLFVSCWARDAGETVCDSFTLAKALDAVVSDPPHILNMSLTGPFDPLLARLLEKVGETGVIVVAARPDAVHDGNGFPAVHEAVIGVGRSDANPLLSRVSTQPDSAIFAPGNRIVVAVPDNAYDFRSGSSLAAAHVSGVVALLLAVSPELDRESVRSLLIRSQQRDGVSLRSVNACNVLQLAGQVRCYQ